MNKIVLLTDEGALPRTFSSLVKARAYAKSYGETVYIMEDQGGDAGLVDLEVVEA